MSKNVASAGAGQSADEAAVLENLSIDDIIGEAYDEVEAAAGDDGDDEKAATGDDKAAAEAGTSGDDNAAGDATAAAAENQDGTKAGEPEPLKPLDHWSADDKATFSKLSRDGQEWMIKRSKEMDRGFNDKLKQIAEEKEQLADVRQRSKQIDEILSPLRAHYNAQGLDDTGAIRQLAAWYHGLQTNPVQTFRQLAQFYNVNLAQLNEQADEYVDPAIVKLQQELGGTRQTLEQLQQQAQQERHAATVRQIQDFAQAKDEQGNLLRPHFDALAPDITMLLQKGIATSLDDAYTKAVAWRPELRATAAPAPAPAAAPAPAPAPASTADRARKAKLAASGMRSSTAQTNAQEFDSWEDAVSAAVGEN